MARSDDPPQPSSRAARPKANATSEDGRSILTLLRMAAVEQGSAVAPLLRCLHDCRVHQSRLILIVSGNEAQSQMIQTTAPKLLPKLLLLAQAVAEEELLDLVWVPSLRSEEEAARG